MTRHLPASTTDKLAAGRALRSEVPRSALAEIPAGSRDPLGIIAEQNATRLQELIPLRTERMSQSAFAFYRGTAAIMAADLATCPSPRISVISCGDAHVSNFGVYASPQRTLVFDLNDFDEAAWAPWEWDVKRLVTSVIVGGRATSRTPEVTERAGRQAVLAYRSALRASLELTPLERYFTHFDAEGGLHRLDKKLRAPLKAAIRAARKRTGERAVRRLTSRGDDGRLRFVERPPTMTHHPDALDEVGDPIRAYAATAPTDIRALLAKYTWVDFARRVVGVGRVGTRCALALFQDGDGNGLILQTTEAGPSVLEQYGRVAQPSVLVAGYEASGQGTRVVALQRVLQAVSDPFLGYLQVRGVDLYVRQFHDMKGSIEVDTLDDTQFISYAQACGITLARAHSQSTEVAVVVGYLGSGPAAIEAILEWSLGYADLSAADYRAFTAGEQPTVP